jgi:hypothetical protein
MLIAVSILASVAACDSNDSESHDPIASVCGKVGSLACSNEDANECTTEMRQMRVEAINDSCQEQFDAYVACLDRAAFTCSAENSPVRPQECTADYDKYSTCTSLAHPICSAIPVTPSPTTPCETTCSDLSVSCSDSAPLQCTCNGGSKSGATFSIQSCDQIFDGLQQNCR